MSLRKRAFLAGAVGLALTLTGCASGSIDGGAAPAGEASEGPTELVPVTYGLFPSSTVAAFTVAIEEGIFEEHGIDLELVVGAGSSAAQLPALTTGDLDFMLASPVTALTASAQGLDVRIVTGVTQNDPDTVEDSTAVLVAEGSPIERARDLEGATVSVNALGSVGEIGIREAVALDGGDPTTIEFVQLSFPEVAAQLQAGQIDAGMTGSPFMQQMLADGGSVVSDFINETGLGENELVTIASGQLVEENPELAEQFLEAMTDALAFLDDNGDLVRAAMPEVLGTDPAVAEKTTLSRYSADLSVETIQLFGDLLYKYEIVDVEPDAEAVVWIP